MLNNPFSTAPPKDLRVEVIGNDGIRRVGYCSRHDALAFEKYVIAPEGVFLTEEYTKEGHPRYEATIVFYEKSAECVKPPGAAVMTPEQCREAVSTASFSISRLLYTQKTQSESIHLLLMGLAAIGALVAAYFAFSACGGIEALETAVNAAIAALPVTSGGTPYVPGTTVVR